MPSSTDARNANIALNLEGKTAVVAGGSASHSLPFSPISS